MVGADSAWFYAALAQTSAAVVGLFGAVLGSHILQHLAAMREERRDLLERVNFVYSHLKEHLDHWIEFRHYLERRVALENSILEVGSALLHPIQAVTWEPEGKEASELSNPDDPDTPEEELKLLLHILPAYKPLEGRVRRSEIDRYASRLRECVSELPPHSKAAQMVTHDAAMLEKLLSRVSRFRSHLFPRSFLVVLLVLAWLSITGIVWPLSALPGLSMSYPQRFMLAALAAGLLVLLGYFAFQFRTLTKLGRIFWTRPH